MRNNFNERFENNANTEITNKSLTKCKEISCPESDYFDDLEELCDRVEKKQKDIKELPKEEDDLFEEKIEESEAAQEDYKKTETYTFFRESGCKWGLWRRWWKSVFHSKCQDFKAEW